MCDGRILSEKERTGFDSVSLTVGAGGEDERTGTSSNRITIQGSCQQRLFGKKKGFVGSGERWK